MTDESRTLEPQPPGDHPTDVERSARSIARLFKNVVSSIVVFAAGDIVQSNTIDVFSSTFVFIILAIGVIIFIVGVLLDTPTSITFIGNAVRGVSRLHYALRQTGITALFAAAVWILGPTQRWREEEWRSAFDVSPKPVRYSFSLVVAATKIRWDGLGRKTAHWVLASNRRTWWPLGSLLALAALNIHLSQGWGSAFYTLPGIVSFYAGVEWLRHRWGIEVKPKSSTRDHDRNEDQTD